MAAAIQFSKSCYAFAWAMQNNHNMIIEELGRNIRPQIGFLAFGS
jgi:hypothetical protein